MCHVSSVEKLIYLFLIFNFFYNLDKIGETDPGVVRSLKMMVNNYDAETESRIFAPLWGGHANINALNKNIKHR